MGFDVLLNVANAVIHKDGKVLIGKRIEGPHPANLGGKWHLPGGKQQPGETPQQNILREIKEETGLDVEIKRFFDVHVNRRITNGKRSIVIFSWFLVEPIGNREPVKGDDLMELKWVPKKEAMGYFPDNFIEHIPWNVKEFLLDD